MIDLVGSELSEFDVRYKPREVIKAQALAEFIVEITPATNQQDGDQGAKQWVVHVDDHPHTMQVLALLEI